MTERPITLPEPFWAAMPADDQEQVHRLTEAGLLLLPSGSRYICPGHHGAESDFDIYGPSESKVAFDLLSNGWESPDYHNTSPEDAAGQSSKADGSISLYRGKLNLILFYQPEKLNRFKDATDFCKSICVTKRDDRVRIFRAVCGEQIPAKPKPPAKAVATKSSAADSDHEFSIYPVAF